MGPQAPDPWAEEPGPLCAPLRVPTGLEDVSKYPDLIAELLRRQWTEEEVRGALANNLLRVFEAVEQVRRAPVHSVPGRAGGREAQPCVCPQASNHSSTPVEEIIPREELEDSCRTYYGYSEAPSLHHQLGALLASLTPALLSLRLL